MLICNIPHMQANGGGVILNIASIAATVGIPDRFAYSTSKGATISMTLSMPKII
ncbi:MAG: SDR family NAD(P)-dependent oxidoreductase [Spirosomataceae bacterium]